MVYSIQLRKQQINELWYSSGNICTFLFNISLHSLLKTSTYTALTDEEHIKKMGLLLDALDDNDDVQNVYHNWEEA